MKVQSCALFKEVIQASLILLSFDLSKEQDCSMSIDAIIKKYGRIDAC